MAKGKLIVAFVVTLFFAYFGRVSVSPAGMFYSSKAPSHLTASNGNLKDCDTAKLSFTKAVTGKSHVKTRYMGGDCSFNFWPFSFRALGSLFAERQINIPAYFLVPSYGRFLFSLRGPPYSHAALA